MAITYNGNNKDETAGDAAKKFLNPVNHAKHTEQIIDDTFSAQDVSDPAAGQWGQAGTAAYDYNQAQQQQGNQALNYQTGQGRAALGNLQNLGTQANQVGTSNSYNSLDAAQAAQGRNAPQAAWGQANQSLGNAQGTVNALNQYANSQGNGPSAAQAAANQANSQGMAQNLALARSGHGFGGNAAAMGQAQGQQAAITANAANQSSAIAAQEDQANKARQLSALNAALGGNMAIAGQQGGQAQFDVNSQLQQRGMNDAYSNANNQNALNWYSTGAGLQQGYQGMGYQTDLAHQQLGNQTNIQHQQLGQSALNSQGDYELQQQQMKLEADKANQEADAQRDSANASMFSSIASSFFGGKPKEEQGGGGGLASDERVKTLKQRESALSKALETVGNAPGYSYKYKDPHQPGAKPGRIVGPMAQDIEKGPLGDTLIIETPRGKMVDTGRLSMVNTAAITELNHQLNALAKALGQSAA